MVWGNEPALAVAPLAENIHFPILAFGQTPAIAAGRKSVVRILGPAAHFGKPIGKYLNSKNAQNIQLIILENTFYKLVADNIKSELTPATTFNTIASVPASESDFRTYLLKLKKTPTDYLGVVLAPSQLLSFFKQANELGITNPIFGSTSFESEAVVKQARQLMNGAVYAHVDVNSDWHQKYLKRFGDDIQVSYAAVAFDTLISIAKIIKAKETITGQELIDQVAALSEYSGAAGFSKGVSSAEHGRYLDYRVVLKKIENGEVKSVEQSE
jgi:ABC-type branched-subunit amino acid transport system substrate-binding protein